MKTGAEIHAEAVRVRNELAEKFPEYRDKLLGMAISLNTRLRTTAGKAKYKLNLIEINPRLYSRSENWHDLRDTVIHEAAHLLAGPRTGHGRVWRVLCLALGGNGKRCHKLDTKGLDRRHYRLVCSCGKVYRVGIVRYRRAKNGKRYGCGRCYSTLMADCWPVARQLKEIPCE